ncbi:hypothetical protein ABII15_05655 [Streptomyces sp. HUAS MG91]|uniref:Type I restriction modification DNA specificity domain-containing protein n=1 Tax=Streptomyces tabacisoli TaxID=3156398 RepID=A0AAU8IM70_9ACTN
MNRTSSDRTHPWSEEDLASLIGIKSVTYSVVEQKQDPEGVPMIGATEIVEGRVIDAEPTRIAWEQVERRPQAMLRAGDLLVVLVGRVGETAVATSRHQGWTFARSVAVIRFTEEGLAQGTDVWLRWWLKTPQSRRYLNVSSTNSEHRTLPLGALRQLPVPVPPAEVRERWLHGVAMAERRLTLNKQIAAHAIELADALFRRAEHTDGRDACAERQVGEIGRIVTGSASSVPQAGTEGTSFVAAKEVLNSRTVHLERTAVRTAVPIQAACPPGTLLVAPRPSGVRTVLATIPVVPGRGALAIRTDSETDQMWLLHALRSRYKELVATAQGQNARAMRRKDFSRFPIPWPPVSVRQDFAERAAALHDLARSVTAENRSLEDLVVHDIAELMNRNR